MCFVNEIEIDRKGKVEILKKQNTKKKQRAWAQTTPTDWKADRKDVQRQRKKNVDNLTTKELNDLQPECHALHMQELEVAAHRIQVTVWTNEQTLGQIAMVKIVLIETDTSSF